MRKKGRGVGSKRTLSEEVCETSSIVDEPELRISGRRLDDWPQESQEVSFFPCYAGAQRGLGNGRTQSVECEWADEEVDSSDCWDRRGLVGSQLVGARRKTGLGLSGILKGGARMWVEGQGMLVKASLGEACWRRSLLTGFCPGGNRGKSGQGDYSEGDGERDSREVSAYK